MRLASQLLALLILTTPIGIIFDGPIIHGLVTSVAAISMAIISVRMRPGEASFLSTVIWPVAIIAAIPALWMLIQVFPLQTRGLVNPIWESAATAFGRPLVGSISIDPGATLVSFVRYVSVAAVVFLAAAVAVDRQRAEWILFTLVAAATLIAMMVIITNIGSITFLHHIGGGLRGNAASNSAGLGVILAGAAALHMFEHCKTERLRQTGTADWCRPTFVASLVAAAICSVALIVGATSQAYFAVVCGLATLAAVVVMRHFKFGPWGIAAVISVTLFIASAIIILQSSNQSVDLTLAFATQAPPPLIAVTQRILSETSWAGTGAGTFSAILPVYRDINEQVAGPFAPTAAAAIAVEMGRPFLWAILMTAIVLVVTLLRGALHRLRDSFYSMAGGGCVVATTVLAFLNEALLSMSVLIILASIVGLAIAQSRSRLT